MIYETPLLGVSAGRGVGGGMNRPRYRNRRWKGDMDKKPSNPPIKKEPIAHGVGIEFGYTIKVGYPPPKERSRR